MEENTSLEQWGAEIEVIDKNELELRNKIKIKLEKEWQ